MGNGYHPENKQTPLEPVKKPPVPSENKPVDAIIYLPAPTNQNQ
jgi:hypothetical protein